MPTYWLLVIDNISGIFCMSTYKQQETFLEHTLQSLYTREQTHLFFKLYNIQHIPVSRSQFFRANPKI